LNIENLFLGQAFCQLKQFGCQHACSKQGTACLMAEHSVKEVCRMGTVRLDEFGKDLGLMHEVVVTGRKVGTPKELTSFFSKLAHDEELFSSLLDSILNRAGLTAAEQLVVEILGEGKVLGYKDVCRVWQRDLPEVEPTMLYTEEILAQAAERNQNGENWRLVYVNGLSLRDQLVVGDNRKKQPCFDKDYRWWRENQQDEWATKAVELGYRLLDFSCPFVSMNWQKQNDAITASGEQFARGEEQAVAEACFSNYLLNGKERLLQNRYHWGFLETANGRLVCVGGFDGNGFCVCNSWDINFSGSLGVVRVWKSPCLS